MNVTVKRRKNITTELSTITPKLGDVFIDTTKPTLVVGDDTTVGGIPLAKETHTHTSASESVAGFMSATDKTKLDNLVANAGIQIVQTSGTPVAAETTINFSSVFTVTDDSDNSRTNVDISQAFKDSLNSTLLAMMIALG